MEVVNSSFLPGDPRLIDHIVYELKSQGIFDNFRKECIADVDTKPAYQNLRQRVEGSVSGFLKTQKWRSDMNKNHVREMLRKNISESGFLETGVERIVDQVVNPKINSIFLPQVENIIYKVLGIQKPTAFEEITKTEEEESAKLDLLPNDLEAVSPESEPKEKKVEVENESKVDEKLDEDESPPFEPLEETVPLEENSVDSNLSGISGLASHDSNHSVENKPIPMETSNQDSQFSKQSSDDRLSIVMSDDQEIKMEINEDSNASKTSISKISDSNPKSMDVPDSSSTDKNTHSVEKSDEQEKPDDKQNDKKKIDKHRSSHKHSSHRSKHDSKDHKDRKTDRDKKDNKSGRTSDDSKERRDKDKDRDKKDRSRSGRDDKGDKSLKERERTTSSSSKHKKKDSKDSLDQKDRSESKDSKSRERSKDDSKLKLHSSKKSDSKSHSKHNGKGKSEPSDSIKTVSKEYDKKDKRDDKYKSEKKNDKHNHKKDSKKYSKKEKDDHYSLKEKKGHRRSTDRDSSDGHSGTHSSCSSYTELTSRAQKSSQKSSLVSGSSSGDSGNSDRVLTRENVNIAAIPCVLSQEEHSQILASVPHLKLIKPKFASNIFEARRLMKIRKKLGKLEKQKQMELMRVNHNLNSGTTNKINNHVGTDDANEDEVNAEDYKKQKQNILKRHVNNSHVKSYKYEEKPNSTRTSISLCDDDNLVEEVQLTEDTELQTSVISSKESWDAIEAKLNAQNILKVDYNSYTEKSTAEEDDGFKGFSEADILYSTDRLNLMNRIIEQQELRLVQISKNYIPKFFQGQSFHYQEGVDVEINKLPKIEVVDVMSNNEIVFSPGRGIKRISSDHDVHNNNKVNKEFDDVLSDRLSEENHDQSSNSTPKLKKPKLTDTTDNFNLPLSPAESDKSFNSISDKKGEALEGRGRRNRAISNQRYSSDDLYKPRLRFTSKRRRTTKKSDVD